jgi:hypothetical protein
MKSGSALLVLCIAVLVSFCFLAYEWQKNAFDPLTSAAHSDIANLDSRIASTCRQTHADMRYRESLDVGGYCNRAIDYLNRSHSGKDRPSCGSPPCSIKYNCSSDDVCLGRYYDYGDNAPHREYWLFFKETLCSGGSYILVSDYDGIFDKNDYESCILSNSYDYRYGQYSSYYAIHNLLASMKVMRDWIEYSHSAILPGTDKITGKEEIDQAINYASFAVGVKRARYLLEQGAFLQETSLAAGKDLWEYNGLDTPYAREYYRKNPFSLISGYEKINGELVNALYSAKFAKAISSAARAAELDYIGDGVLSFANEGIGEVPGYESKKFADRVFAGDLKQYKEGALHNWAKIDNAVSEPYILRLRDRFNGNNTADVFAEGVYTVDYVESRLPLDLNVSFKYLRVLSAYASKNGTLWFLVAAGHGSSPVPIRDAFIKSPDVEFDNAEFKSLVKGAYYTEEYISRQDIYELSANIRGGLPENKIQLILEVLWGINNSLDLIIPENSSEIQEINYRSQFLEDELISFQGIETLSVHAKDTDGDNASEDFFMDVRLADGASEVRINRSIIVIKLNDSVTFITSDKFSYEYLQRGPDNIIGYITRGDVLRFSYKPPRKIGSGEELMIEYVPGNIKPEKTRIAMPITVMPMNLLFLKGSSEGYDMFVIKEILIEDNPMNKLVDITFTSNQPIPRPLEQIDAVIISDGGVIEKEIMSLICDNGSVEGQTGKGDLCGLVVKLGPGALRDGNNVSFNIVYDSKEMFPKRIRSVATQNLTLSKIPPGKTIIYSSDIYAGQGNIPYLSYYSPPAPVRVRMNGLKVEDLEKGLFEYVVYRDYFSEQIKLGDILFQVENQKGSCSFQVKSPSPAGGIIEGETGYTVHVNKTLCDIPLQPEGKNLLIAIPSKGDLTTREF